MRGGVGNRKRREKFVALFIGDGGVKKLIDSVEERLKRWGVVGRYFY